MIYRNVLEAVGQTPLIRLNRMPEPGSAEVLVKFEDRAEHDQPRGEEGAFEI